MQRNGGGGHVIVHRHHQPLIAKKTGHLKDERTVSQKVQLVNMGHTNAGTFAMITAHLTAKKALLKELRDFHFENTACTCNARLLIVSLSAEPMQSGKFI
ncbi:hypothetical protein EDD52_10518 [Primorskyibacter sedentarius]|uniref:Uncharacterized protein n=1 Tax=Primorskyibacter sedentarius TaxID=745311 RepID=A0A4R3JEH1_9RHOB|nr:hypothetical protein [Primorskyibacter sedentarius]TCS64458.1 hypothetical protein EDD52_10518 [Primorskyibacter sedentarius]